MNNINKKTTKKRVSDGDRFAQLSRIGEAIFTTADLATIWGIENRNTLRMTLARYVARGLFYRIWRGLYSIVDPRTLDPRIVGIKALHTYAYISCESVLFDAGIINQRPSEVTIVSNLSKRFALLGVQYRVRKMRDASLYDDAGITLENGIRVATPARAKKDMTYFNPKKYYDANI